MTEHCDVITSQISHAGGRPGGVVGHEHSKKTLPHIRCHLFIGVQVLGLQEHSVSDVLFNPPESTLLAEGATLVVMGELEKITKLRGLA